MKSANTPPSENLTPELPSVPTRSFTETIEKFKSASMQSHDDFLDALVLIGSIKDQLGPEHTLMLQMDAIIRHYNINKNIAAPEMTIADAALIAKTSRSPSKERY